MLNYNLLLIATFLTASYAYLPRYDSQECRAKVYANRDLICCGGKIVPDPAVRLGCCSDGRICDLYSGLMVADPTSYQQPQQQQQQILPMQGGSSRPEIFDARQYSQPNPSGPFVPAHPANNGFLRHSSNPLFFLFSLESKQPVAPPPPPPPPPSQPQEQPPMTFILLEHD